MNPRPEIEALARKVAQRHNAFLLRYVFLVALMSVAGVLALGALIWVTRGYSVPWIAPAIVVVAGVIGAVAYFISKRMDIDQAVAEADQFFELKNGIATARHLATTAPDDPVTHLQWNWLSPRLGDCDPRAIARPFPRKRAAMAVALAALASVLCLLPPSDAVRAAEERAEETRQRVAEAKDALEELLDEMEDEVASKDDEEEVSMDEYRKMIKEIDETGDRAEAARQFARIERKVREAARGLDQQRDEETLKLTAKELKKSEDTDARKLGKKLDQKELKEAAEMLKKLAAKKFDKKDFDGKPMEQKKALDQAKKDLAKMRAATKRMAAAGKQRQAARELNGAKGAPNAKAGGAQMDDGGMELEDMLAELDEAAEEMEEGLEELEFDPDAEFDEEAGDRMARMKGKLGEKLKKMHGKRMARSKLDALRAALSQAQGHCQGQSQQAMPGGKKPGKGSQWTKRDEQDDLQKNGGLAQLKGQHGQGPSLSAVEEAESGSGVSSRRGTAKERDFNRQMESFVQRDDVPESLKLGVRNYFENLQSARAE